MEVESEIYQVSNKLVNCTDDSWHEYHVKLLDDSGKILDEWDSRHETYNGNEGQRLSYGQADKAVKEITRGVNCGKESRWFNIRPEL